jgi:anhydro-N-acetylmuramic acid kinase
MPPFSDLTARAEKGVFIGVMSGTSMDGIDACAVDFSGNHARVIAHQTLDLGELAKDMRLLALGNIPKHIDAIDFLGQLDAHMAERVSTCVKALLSEHRIQASDIVAIGSHGQTVRHRPASTPSFTLQIGDPNVIAERTGIAVVADFRRRDMAAGGQGAPLVPPAHRALFGAKEGEDSTLITINLGGIGNIAVMTPDAPLLGFDTGPANTLMDAWIKLHRGLSFDDNGLWAASGKSSEALLRHLLNEPFFRQAAPKSTGIELFNLDWLRAQAVPWLESLPPEDIQATLASLTAQTIAESLRPWLTTSSEPLVVLAGGGARNKYLTDLIRDSIHNIRAGTRVETSDLFGIDPQCVECAAFAWLARQFLLGEGGNAPSVTGAEGLRILGGFFPA